MIKSILPLARRIGGQVLIPNMNVTILTPGQSRLCLSQSDHRAAQLFVEHDGQTSWSWVTRMTVRVQTS